MNKAEKIFVIAVMFMLAGCASAPVILSSPVGPNHYGRPDGTENGRLEVFSSMEGQIEGDNPTWFQHTDYRILTAKHQPFKHVWNKVGYYTQEPRVVSLPAGKYLVDAQSTDFFSVEVPVVIQQGKLTTVHLDGKWMPPAGASKAEIIYLPQGCAVGWCFAQNQQDK